MTPLEAIRKICVACVGSPYEVNDCRGDQCLGGQGDENGICFFYNYRIGKGRPSVKLIRRFCLECLGGRRQLVSECRCSDCPLHEYRFGKNPRRAGIGNKNAIPPGVRTQIRSQNLISQLET